MKKSKVVEKSTPVTIKYIAIQSRIDSHFVYIGQVSGQQYEWTKAGETVQVLEEDAPGLLAKRLGKKTCCGDGYNQIFQLA